MKKVIILYSTGGMGHKKAAIALEQAFNRQNRPLVVKNIDTLEYANKFCRFLYNDWYVYMMTKGKVLWGWMYKFTNIDFIGKLFLKLREFLEMKNFPGLDEMLCEEDPDAVITTHFILPAIAEKLRNNEKFKAKLFVSLTDYGPHSFWISSGIDKYFLGTETMVDGFKARLIDPSKLSVTGIPSVEDFMRDYDIDALRDKYGLIKGKKTIFMLSGGFGVGPMEEILKSLDSVKADIQVITVCGYNKKSYASIDKMKNTLSYPVVLFGFTDKVAELMAVSDLMITKAGGMSVTEAMNMSLPMILIDSIPGQETWNEEMLLSGSAAEKACKLQEIPHIVNNLFLSDDAYEILKEGIAKVRKPAAADNIVREVLEDIE